MRELEACFACTTPFQIMNSIALTVQLKIKADLYVVNQFSDAEKVCERIAQEQIFENVRCVDEKPYKFRENKGKIKPLIWAKSITNYLKIDQIGRQILVKNTAYRTMYISSEFMVAGLLESYFRKNKTGTEKILFDDGAGSYMDRNLISLSLGTRLVRRLILGQREFEQLEPTWLYSPELYHKINGDSGHPVYKINNYFHDQEIVGRMNRIFQYDPSNCIAEKVLLIDFIKEKFLTAAERRKTDAVYDDIFAEYGLQNILVKRHPRDPEPKEEGKKYYSNDQIPFECLCANMEFGGKILISVSSTAVITPKLFFDQEPCVIALYKLIHLNYWDEAQSQRIDRLFQSCREIYADSERFFIPATMEELHLCLKKANEIC